MSATIPVIDLFAGPGGLGEGFAAFPLSQPKRAYRIALSIEKDEFAHRTLELRAFFRQFPRGEAPEEYYRHLRDPQTLTREELFAQFPHEAALARTEAWHAELGVVPEAELDERIAAALGGAEDWLLIGGPPCQAYSVVGRARRGGLDAADPRVHLYREYLRILAVHQPPVFVMENVKGLLSSRIGAESVFERMLRDLSHPAEATGMRPAAGVPSEYQILSLVPPDDQLFAGARHDPHDYVIRCEEFGIPQARHRVILLGVRQDVDAAKRLKLRRGDPVPVRKVLDGLPRLRSGLSRGGDSAEQWRSVLQGARESDWFGELEQQNNRTLGHVVTRVLEDVSLPRQDRGAEFVSCDARCEHRPEWYLDPRLGGVCNHTTRGHIPEDLHRYLFAASFARKAGRSPTLKDFPEGLLPRHQNVNRALKTGHFADRFRVQVSGRPATTVTSHIAKDGHYYIHYDPTQCRSLTVREAARIQTFPDNYYFCGGRTQQYQQVGNAVPPLLAYEIARAIYPLFGGGQID